MVKAPRVRISDSTSKRTDDCVKSNPPSDMCYPHLDESEFTSHEFKDSRQAIKKDALKYLE